MPNIDLKLGREPTLILYLILLAVNAVQVAALELPDWAHTVIVVVSTILAAILNRSQVTPAAGIKPVGPSDAIPTDFNPSHGLLPMDEGVS